MLKKAIVITSIFGPSKGIKLFSELNSYKLFVVGDNKTPKNWHCDNVEFISIEKQTKLHYQIIQKLPFDHYSRKMVGYLAALNQGFDTIIDTDDDNIPYSDWAFPDFEGNYIMSPKELGFVNIYKSFTAKNIWPRGFPLNKILDIAANSDLHGKYINEKTKIGVWQGLADGDPDVDALYRLTINEECIFDKREPLVLGEKTIAPFNSQNTAYVKECFPLLYLPAYVTFRFTDILRGLIAQPIMWRAGFQLGFTRATVFQERNAHNYLNDFESEIPCYLNAEKVIELVSSVVQYNNSLSDNLREAYLILHKNKIVPEEELQLLELWLSDLKTIK